MRYALVLLALLSAVPDARACECVPSPSLERAWSSSNAIFVGTVLGWERSEVYDVVGFPMLFTHFQVERVYKGPISDHYHRVSLLYGSSNCEMHFEAGKRYLVYADEHYGLLYGASMCTRTVMLSEADDKVAADELAALEALAAAQPVPDDTAPPQYVEVAELNALHALVKQSVSPTYRDLLYLSGVANLALMLGLFWMWRRKR